MTSATNRSTPSRVIKRSRGFGLVELMIAVVLGMLSTVIIFQVFATFEGRRRSTTSGMDATESGLMGLLAIERESRHAGLGLIGYGRGSERQIVCRSINSYAVATGLTTANIQPLRIVDGGAGSDELELVYGSSPFAATPARLNTAVMTSDPAGTLTVSNAASGNMFAVGDFIVVSEPAQPTKPCALLRVTGQFTNAAGVHIEHASTDPANPPVATNIFPVAPTFGYQTTASNPALVINLGTIQRIRYRIVGNSLEVMDLAAGTAEIIADGVVAIQAQYGVTANAASPDISAWVNATGGTWANPTAADVARIKAVRVAVIARAALAEREDVTNATCTTRGGTVNAGPCAWIDDSVSDPAPAIDLSGLGSDWRRFRYRVYETVIPLRNVIWGDVNT